MHNAALGDFCRRRRKGKGLSQDVLARKTGLDVNTIRNLEAGRGITLRTLSAVAVALRVPLDTLARVAARGRT
jgi:transcriptional regulator with XRE-family HTH domain